MNMENIRTSLQLTDIYNRVLAVISGMHDEVYSKDDVLLALEDIALKLQEGIGELNLQDS